MYIPAQYQLASSAFHLASRILSLHVAFMNREICSYSYVHIKILNFICIIFYPIKLIGFIHSQ